MERPGIAMIRGLTVVLAAAWLAFPRVSRAERSFNWRAFRATDGLSSAACSSVTPGPQGKILLTHPLLPWVTEFDGYVMTNLSAPSSRITRVYESPAGQLWTVASEGVYEFRDGEWILHPPGELGIEARGMADSSLNEAVLCPIRQGLVVILLPDRLVQFSSEAGHSPRAEVLRQASETVLGSFVAMVPSYDGGLWISGLHGLAKLQGPLRSLTPESGWQEFRPPEDWRAERFRIPRESPRGELTLLADSATNHDRVLITTFDGRKWSAIKAVSEPLRQAWRGPENTLWAVTRESLLQYPEGSSEPIENTEISPRQFFDVAVEPAGSFWLATSDGLFRYAPLCWQSPATLTNNDFAIRCLALDAEGGVWFIAGNALHSLVQERYREYLFPAYFARSLQGANAIFPVKNGTLAIGTGQQLVKFNPVSGSFSRLNGLAGERGQLRPVGFVKEGVLAIQTVSNFSSTNHALRLQVYDGAEFSEFPVPLPDHSVGATISALFAAHTGDLWISGELGTAWFHDGKWRGFPSGDKSGPGAAGAFIELADGKIWCGTQDGIWQFEGKDWLNFRRGFDGISSLLQTRDGSVWVGCNNGLFRYYQGAWVENGIEEGLPSSNVRGVCEDRSEHLWAGTSRGLSLFRPKADPDPPRTVIYPVSDKEKNVPEGGALTVIYGGQDKWKFTNRSRLLYAHRLDDREWSAFLEKDNVSFSELPAGKHYFQVRAMDRNGNVDPKPSSLEFVVVLPWYREKRLLLITSAGLAAALFFAALAFNRHRRLLHSYAEVERKVNERTGELERANRELLHSQKMNALGTLAAGIAHDFNNILSIIKGSAQIIEENLQDPQKIGTRVERINTVVEQGAGIVKAMLGFSRESDQQTGPCDLNVAVEDTIRLLGDRFLREVQVSFEPGANLEPVACSKDLIQQILLNFIFNAAESMSRPKHIWLTTRKWTMVEESPVLVPGSAASYACISVKDIGCGIPAENLSRIFEPFFTTKAMSARRGTGLGLSMVYELAKKMSAGLAVTSSVGEGSTFTLILPVVKAEKLPPMPTETSLGDNRPASRSKTPL